VIYFQKNIHILWFGGFEQKSRPLIDIAAKKTLSKESKSYGFCAIKTETRKKSDKNTARNQKFGR